jgi:hypothetical protein
MRGKGADTITYGRPESAAYIERSYAIVKLVGDVTITENPDDAVSAATNAVCVGNS